MKSFLPMLFCCQSIRRELPVAGPVGYIKRKAGDARLIEVRCGGCGRLLGRFHGKGDVKCPKTLCGGRNVFDTECGKYEFIPKKTRAGKKRKGGGFDGGI